MNASQLLALADNHALQIAIVATIVLLITRFIAHNRPVLAHALWALVLLKCLTPPIVASPTSPFSWLAAPQSSTSNAGLSTPAQQITTTTQISTEAQLNPSSPIANQAAASRFSRTKIDKPTWSISTILIAIWLTGSLALLLANGIRLVRFQRLVRRSRVQTPIGVSRIVAELREQLGVRRQVQTQVLDALIGPAVMGLFRPTLLLPTAIVRRCSPAQLRTIIAHELVHVRRGDLWWSACQCLVASMWWFHPAAWLASRQLSRESERSCDEQTIASLGCVPADYARSLIAVLETKQQLTAVPLVPGLRPVDITFQRMERIMKLRHGRHQPSRLWTTATLVLGVITLLPGAAWLHAQEAPKTPRPQTTDSLLPTAAPMAPAANQNKPLPPGSIKLSFLIMEVPTYLALQIANTGDPSLGPKSSTVRPPLSGEVVPASASSPLVPKSSTTASLGESPNLSGVVHSDLGVSGKVLLADTQALPLDDGQLQKVLQWQSTPIDYRTRTLSRPSLTLLNGKLASARIGTTHAISVPAPQVNNDTGKQNATDEIFTGLVLEATASASASDSAHTRKKQAIQLDFQVTRTAFVSTSEFATTDSSGQPTELTRPKTRSQSISTSFASQVGKSHAFVMGKLAPGGDDFTTFAVVTVDSVGLPLTSLPTDTLSPVAPEKRIPIVRPTTSSESESAASAPPSDAEVTKPHGGLRNASHVDPPASYRFFGKRPQTTLPLPARTTDRQ